MNPLLDITGLTVRFGEVVALRNVSLSVEAGEIVTLIGPNGSGKSTLLRAALGLVRRDGRIAWDQKPISDWTIRSLARRVAYLPQSPTHEPGQTIREVLRMGRAGRWGAFGIEHEEDHDIVESVFAKLDLADRAMESLSGGQRQRVFIGRCLVQQPAALLLDEPDTFLDLSHSVQLHQTLRELAGGGMAILMTSHDINQAASRADRLCLLDRGEVRAIGTPSEVMRVDALSEIFGVPMERIERTAGPPLIVPKM